MEQQTDKLRLLEMTFKKVSSDPGFIACALQRVSEIKGWTQNEVLAYFNCPPADFYKLGLSKAPNPLSTGYEQRLTAISAYAGIDADKLNYMLVLAGGFQSLKPAAEFKTLEQVLFLDWRQSENKLLQKAFGFSNRVETQLYALYTKVPAVAYRTAAILAFILFAFLFSNTPVDEKSFYASVKPIDKTMGRQLALRDNTTVYKLPFTPKTREVSKKNPRSDGGREHLEFVYLKA